MFWQRSFGERTAEILRGEDEEAMRAAAAGSGSAYLPAAPAVQPSTFRGTGRGRGRGMGSALAAAAVEAAAMRAAAMGQGAAAMGAQRWQEDV